MTDTPKVRLSGLTNSEVFDAYCLTVLRSVAEQPGYHTVRRLRYWLTFNPHYATALGLRRAGLLRMPWLRLYITDAGRAALKEIEDERPNSAL